MSDLSTIDKASPAADLDTTDATARLSDLCRKLGGHIYRLGGEIVAIALAIGIVALFAIGGLLSRQSADLAPLRPTFERWFSQSFEGARAELGDLQLSWNPSDDSVSFSASDVIVYDEDGQALQTLERLRATMSRADLLSRSTNLRDIVVVGGEVTYLVREDGSVLAGLGTPSTVGGFGPVYRGGTNDGSGRDMAWLEGFQSLRLEDSRVHVRRDTDGLALSLDVEALDGRIDGEAASLSFTGRALSDGDVQAGRLALSIDSPDSFETFDVRLEAIALRPDLLAPPRGRLAVLSAMELPVDLRLAGVNSRSEGLKSAQARATFGEGSIRLAGRQEPFGSIVFEASLDPGEEVMTVDTLSVDAERLRFQAEGTIRDIGRWSDGDMGTSPKFDLGVSAATIDLTPTFEAPVDVARADVVGELDLDSRMLTFDTLDMIMDGFGLALEGQVATREDGLSKVLLSGRSTTPLTGPDLLSIWPVQAADGARRWIERSVMEGTVQKVRFEVDLDADFFEEPLLTTERLQLDFDVSDGVVRYISTMEPLSDARGSGRIDGNRLGFVLEGGRIGDVRIVGGDVDIPRLTPKGGDILISAQAQGELPDLLALINQPPFQYMDRYGVSADGFGGQADVTLNIRRPLLEFFDQDRIEYAVSGRFTDASAPFDIGGYSVTGADLVVEGGKEGLFLDGPANIGPWRANLSWAERYGRNGKPTRYRVTGVMDRKTLDAFGLGFREVFGGEIDVDLEASGTGLNITDGLLTAGLERAELAFGSIWSKPAGEAGRVRAVLQRSNEVVSIPSLSMTAPGLDLNGALFLRPTMGLDRLELDRAMVEGLIDGRLTLSRNNTEGGLALTASGEKLDVSQFVANALESRSASNLPIPLSVEAEFQSLVLSADYALQDSRVIYDHDGETTRDLLLEGRRPSGDAVVSIEPTEDGTRAASLYLPDVSDAARAFLGLASTQGGDLRIDATLPPAGMDAPMLGTASATAFTLRDAPFLAQILSLASLTGIVETLSGSGLSFDELTFDFAMQDRDVSIRDAKLRGPAIGMTGEGEISLDDREIDFGGTLVPAYTANSILGDVPILGDLFVGRDGEGVFAVTYTVDGPFSNALVAINPLSALTPGFIRGIFREQRSDLPESIADAVESVRPDEQGGD
ncbi:MAG: AsmA-like C-terminal domain-containing protein [Litorimonas sp.]